MDNFSLLLASGTDQKLQHAQPPDLRYSPAQLHASTLLASQEQTFKVLKLSEEGVLPIFQRYLSSLDCSASSSASHTAHSHAHPSRPTPALLQQDAHRYVDHDGLDRQRSPSRCSSRKPASPPPPNPAIHKFTPSSASSHTIISFALYLFFISNFDNNSKIKS